MKKQLLILICLIFSTLSLFAQAPQKLNYQGIARTTNGEPMQNRNLGLRISILDGATAVYVETNNISTNGFGLYKLAIGAGTPITGSMATIDWSNGNKFIKVEIDPNGGSNYTTLGTNELLSVPYALYAASSGSTGDGSPQGPAGGDLTGTYPNPEIANNAVYSSHIKDGEVKTADLDNNAVTTPKIADNAINTAKVADGAISSPKIAAMGATDGQVLKFNGTNWVPALDETGGGAGDDWGTQVTQTTDRISGNGTAANPLDIAQQGAANGQVLKWNGANWVPANDEIGAGGGGDDWGAQVVQTDATLNGQGTIAIPLSLANAAVTGEKINQMGAANGQVLKWNGATWEPANDVGGGAGDDWGTQVTQTDASLDGDGTAANPLSIADNAITTDKLTIAAVTGEKINQMGAANGQVLKWNGAIWEPANDVGGGAGDDWGTQVTQTDTSLDGDGTAANPLSIADNAITSSKLDAMGAVNGQVLKFDGVNWIPGTDNEGAGGGVVYTAGNGIDISAANEISADISTNELQNASVTGEKIDQMGAANGQVLKWNGATWEPAHDVGGGAGDDWGAQIVETDATLKGDGTAGNELGLAQNGATDGQILIWDDVSSSWIPASQTIGGDGFFEVDNDQIVYSDAANFGKDFLLNTNQINKIPGEIEFKMMFLPSKYGAFRAGVIENRNWDIDSIGPGSVAFGYETKALGTISVAMGHETEASGYGSTALGRDTEALGEYAIAMGNASRASAWVSTAIGQGTKALGYRSTAMGRYTEASGDSSTSMGNQTEASGEYSTAMGNQTEASGETSIAMGFLSKAAGQYSTAMGTDTKAEGEYSTAMGNTTIAIGKSSLSTGKTTTASGENSISGGDESLASGQNSIAIGWQNEATNWHSVALGAKTMATSHSATSLGYLTKASGSSSIAMGHSTLSSGTYSSSMGNSTIASGYAATAMGSNSKAINEYSTAIGFNTQATGSSSLALGTETKATGQGSTAMGYNTIASGEYSTAMGGFTQSSGTRSTAMGTNTIASGYASTSMGLGSRSIGNYSTTMGQDAEAWGQTSTAIGRNAKAKADNSTAIGRNIELTAAATGSMFLGDNSRTGQDIWGKTGTNRFYAVFDNGYVLHTNGTTNSSFGVTLSHNSNSWSSMSDRNKKENIKIAEGNYFIESIKKMELGSWNYIGQNAKEYRHWGPMAQDFDKYFGHDGIGKIGTDTTIATADIDGVMMIAIQQLARENDSLKSKIAELKQLVDNQKELASAKQLEFDDQTLLYKKAKSEMEERMSRIEAFIHNTEQKIKYTAIEE